MNFFLKKLNSDFGSFFRKRTLMKFSIELTLKNYLNLKSIKEGEIHKFFKIVAMFPRLFSFF